MTVNPNKKKSLHRTKIIKGHIEAIQKMIEEDKYCVDIIHQSMAVQKALKRLDMEVIEGHLTSCVVDQMKTGKERKSIRELLALYEMK